MDRTEIDRHRLAIAVGVGKGLGKIKNKDVSWKNLLARLEEPSVDNSITLAQYLNLNPDGKLERKRAAGFWMAAKYKGSSRKVADVIGKSCIVLDLDHITHDQLDYIQSGLAEINRWTWAMQTSRSHTPEKPRWRMVIPCSRLMTPEEAHAITRLVSLYLADDADEAIEIPDLISFRTNQAMFFPSVSKGQEFLTARNYGEILDVDAFLEEHPYWTDFEHLPYQAAEKQRGKIDPNRKMEDPREKPEPIGAWCRAFTVEDVIDRWLSDVYARGDCSTETRYTYLPGTGSNGAVVYDGGLFLHSNHGSDPIEGSANAFDLLRIHKFGHLDAEAHANTGPGNMPSFKKMVEFAYAQPEVLAELYATHDAVLDDLDEDEDEDEDEDRDEDEGSRGYDDDPEVADLLGDTLDDLPDNDDGEKKQDDTWRTNFRRKANNKLEPVLNNVALIVANDRRIKDCIGYNEFTHDPVCLKPIRAPKIDTPSARVPRHKRRWGRRWEDADDYSISLICSANAQRGGYETDFPDGQIQKAVLAAGKNNPVHPVKDDVEDCWARWKAEGSPRGLLESYAIEFLGVPDTPFHRQSAAKLILGSIARTYEPGCKFDTMTVIEGETGSGKSTFWEVLFGRDFVTELKCDLHETGRLIEQIRGFRALEMAEMTPAKRADSNTLKMQLSSSRDVYRLAYGKREQEFQRQCVFVGTSNDDDYLTDPTSSRRFWIWKSPKNMFDQIDNRRLAEVRHLIWGEGYQVYLDMRAAQKHGDLMLDLEGADVLRERDTIANGSRRRTVAEEVADVVQEWLDTPRPACEVLVNADGLTEAGLEDDEMPMVRNMVTAKEALVALRHEDTLSSYRGLDLRLFGKALSKVPGWTRLGRVRRFGEPQAVWYIREGGEDWVRWVPAPRDAGDREHVREVDDLLG